VEKFSNKLKNETKMRNASLNIYLT